MSPSDPPVKLVYAPQLDDPDEPDEMTEEEMKQMADAIADYMGWDKKEEKGGPKPAA